MKKRKQKTKNNIVMLVEKAFQYKDIIRGSKKAKLEENLLNFVILFVLAASPTADLRILLETLKNQVI